MIYLILFSVDDEAYVRVVHPQNIPAGVTILDLARMIEYRHTTTARVVELLPDHDDTEAIQNEYEEVS